MDVKKQTGTANTTVSKGRKISYLAIHYTAGVSCKAGTASGVASWFANPTADGSADYIVDEGGLTQYNPNPKNRYCHAVGGNKYNTKGGRLYGVAKNANCISLEICSGNKTGKITVPNDPNYYFTDAVITKAIEATKYLMGLYGIDADHVIRHYDVNGKPCPGVIGWNADSGSEEKWNAFHAAISGTVKASGIPSSKEAYIEACGAIAREMMKETKILASVVTAQCCLETGFGLGSDAKVLTEVNNILGMKTDLINNTWKQYTVWGGESITKKTPEYVNKRLIYKEDSFRKYTDYENCIRDYEMFLLHVQNDKGYKYARVAGMTDAAEVIHAIRIGTGTSDNTEGYCTDPNYETKILALIKDFNLDRFNTEEVKPAPVPTTKKGYRVQVGCFKTKANAEERLKLARLQINPRAWTFTDKKGTHVIVGSYTNKINADAMKQSILNRNICEASVEEYDA